MNKKIPVEIRNLAILTLFTVSIWIGYEVYRIYNNPTIPQEYQDMAKPFNPTVDFEFIRGLSLSENR